MIRSAEAVPALPADAPEASASSNIYRIAWQRKALIILALVIAGVLGALYYANTPPVYESKAKILVIRKSPQTMGADNVTAFVEDYLTTHTQLLQSPAIIANAVESKDLKNLSMFAGMDTQGIVNTVIGGLTVARDGGGAQSSYVRSGSSILLLTFRGGEAMECARVLEAVIASYKSYLDRMYSDKSSQVIEYLKKTEGMFIERIQILQQELNEFLVKNPLLDVSGTEVGVARAERRKMIEGHIIEAEIRSRDLEIRIETIEQALRSNNPQAAMLLLAMEYTRSFGDSMKQNVALDINNRVFELETRKLEAANEYGANHPVIRALNARIEHLKQYGQKQQASGKKLLENPLATDEKSKSISFDEDNPLVSSIGAQKLEVENLKRKLKHWKEQLAVLKEEAKFDAPNELKFRLGMQNLADMREQNKAITKVLQNFDMTKETGGITADVVFPPALGYKVEPKPVTIFALAGILGILSGFGLAYLADATDKSFRSPEEIRRRLNLPVLGHIPSLLSEEEEKAKADGVAGPDPILVTYYKSKSRKAEVFRAVRTALFFNTRGEGHKVIQITSPNMGDGKTTLSTNLAVSVAQSGKRIVLIDADFRRPRIHKVFGVGNDVGFTSVLTGQCELREAIQASPIPGLSIMSCGPIPPNPAELLTSPRFKELIDELREQFDYVLVDTPPLLVVTDPCVVAPRVDGVLLCIRVAKNGRPVAERAREVLVSLGANVLGVVVNGISLFGQGYGYGYSYGYQYGQYDYGTQYQYKYEYYDRYYGPYDDYYNDKDEDGMIRKAPPKQGALPPAPAAAPAGSENAGKEGWLNRMFGKK